MAGDDGKCVGLRPAPIMARPREPAGPMKSGVTARRSRARDTVMCRGSQKCMAEAAEAAPGLGDHDPA